MMVNYSDDNFSPTMLNALYNNSKNENFNLESLDESIFIIFDFLTLKELSRVAATSKIMHSLVHDEMYSRTLFIPKLKLSVIQNNALALYNYPSESFYVTSDLSLVPIKPYNLYGRCYNWLYPSENQAAVNEVVKVTLCEIYRVNIEGLQYDKEAKIYPTQLYVWDLRDVHLAYPYIMKCDRVAFRVIKSPQFNTRAIHKAALRLINQLEAPRESTFYNMYCRIGKHKLVTN